MNNQLTRIILQKQREIEALQNLLQNQPEHAIAHLLQGKTRRYSVKKFKKALRCSYLAIIAEIKRKSPSKGLLAPILDPVSLAMNYIEGGANAISVLTDEIFFNGTLRELSSVAFVLEKKPCPILRKDFILHEIQIAEAITMGADAILCIVAILGKKTKALLAQAKAMGIEVLVEVHNHAELDIALESDADIIGINNRDLSTFQVDTECALRLVEHIPSSIVKVAESGILVPKLARDYYQAGFDAVLIGEALVKSASPSDFMKACRHD